MEKKENQVGKECRVFLIAVGDNSEEKKEAFCHAVSEKFGISPPLLRKIVDRCPIVLKRNLSIDKAMTLAKTLKSFGAKVSVEAKRDFQLIHLEFQKPDTSRLSLESSHFRLSQSGSCHVVGRVRNVSTENLNDLWVLVEVFDPAGEFLTFEEVPTPINPLPPGESSPFKAVFEGSLPIEKVTLTFKNALGNPIASADRRETEKWVALTLEEDEEEEVLSIEISEPPPLHPPFESAEEVLEEKLSIMERKDLLAMEPEGAPPSVEEGLGKEEEGMGTTVEAVSEASPEPTSIEMDLDLKEEIAPVPSGEIKAEGIGPTYETGWTSKERPPEKPPFDLEETLMEKRPEAEETTSMELERPAEDRRDGVEAHRFDTPAFEETPQWIGTLARPLSERMEESSAFPWIKDFRNSIENYYEEHPDSFCVWFESRRRENEFKDYIHSLLTILIHARFDQGREHVKILENTERVFKIVLQPDLSLEKIPPLEGTQFFSEEDWRALFHNALPRLQQTAQKILKQKTWEASELERVIQIIPHMGRETSRRAVRWIYEMIPNAVEVNFSNIPVQIEESLYRVACRLGVIDPHFDFYDGRNSAAELKIQSFAKEAFPEDPIRIEEPMRWVGKSEEGGYCLPAEPQCERCLFEAFCLRLFLHFNPSEKGMAVR